MPMYPICTTIGVDTLPRRFHRAAVISCAQSGIDHNTALAVLQDCRVLLASLPGVKWALVVREMGTQLQMCVLGYIWANWSSVAGSHGFR